MSSTRIEVRLNRIESNARYLRRIYGAKGIKITAVTKGVCGAPLVAAAILRAGISSLGDSRLGNLRRMRDAGLQAEFMLIRPPRASEAAAVVRQADISLNSELSVVKLLGEHARAIGTTHRIILMVELGDLREGVLPRRLDDHIQHIRRFPGVTLEGLGTNLACLNGIVPTDAKMRELSRLVEHIEDRFGLAIRVVSGGNSANHVWATSTVDMGRINHLRIGEALLLGRETVNRRPIPGMALDAFRLVGEVIEVKTKPSKPCGDVGLDAFGRVPTFSDKGPMRRAIVALGVQDLDTRSITPRVNAEVVGACSDQLVLQDRSGRLQVGSEVAFDVGYPTLLRAMTSQYVEKVFGPTVRPSQRPKRPAHRHQLQRRGAPAPWAGIGPSRWDAPASEQARGRDAPTANSDSP